MTQEKINIESGMTPDQEFKMIKGINNLVFVIQIVTVISCLIASMFDSSWLIWGFFWAWIFGKARL